MHRTQWIHSAATDTLIALLWVPFAVAGFALQHDNRLPDAIAAVLLLSFTHQPVTAALVYGDRAQFRLARRIFTFSPVVFVAGVLALRHWSFALLAIIAGLWNAEHTLMQRYGITRIYGRKGGDDHGRLEKYMLFSWLALALVVTAADARTPARIDTAGLGGHNREGLDVLTDFRTPARLLLPLAIAVVAVLAALWVRRERKARGNRAKWVYVGSTAALFAIIFVNPIAGFMGYVGAHAVEYFIIVGRSVGPRYSPANVAAQPSPIGALISSRAGRLKFFGLYALAMAAIVGFLRASDNLALNAAIVFTLGGMHVFYDGFIWKLRRPVVAQSLGIA